MIFVDSAGLHFVKTNINKFNDQEFQIEISESLHNEEVVIIQSTSSSINDRIIELLLIADAAKNSQAKKIIAIIPYYGYGRQDNLSSNQTPLPARLIAKLIEAAGIEEVIIIDLHSKHIEDFFKIKVYNVSPIPIFTPIINLIENCLKCLFRDTSF